MFIVISLIIFIIVLLIYNRLYFFFSKEIVFKKYLTFFLLYTLIIFFILQTTVINFYLKNLINTQDIISSLFIYFTLYLSLFLTIGLKSMSSPSEIIFDMAKKKISFKKLLNNFKRKNIIKNRLEDLIKQNLIIKRKNSYYLTSSSKNFVIFLLFLKKIYKIKIEG